MKCRFETLVISLAALAASCAEYDPPPEATLQQPEEGAFAQGDPVNVTFSEAVDDSTVSFRVWPAERNVENELPDSVEPLVETCNVDETCGDLTVSLEGSDKATLQFDGELGTPGRPLIVELLPGVADELGNDTGEPKYWDLQFKTTEGVNAEPVEFDNGVYIVLAQVEDPLPAVLTLISEVRVLEDGSFALAGAEGDEINGAPKNTRNPENLIVDETDQGYTVFTSGFVTVTEDGKRLLETDPVDITTPAGPLDVKMSNVRLFADIVKDDTGKDKLEGTLSFDSLTLINGERESEQPGGSTALVADFVPPDLVPEGHPELCGDLCGAVELGLCEPPEDFPGEGFCEE